MAELAPAPVRRVWRLVKPRYAAQAWSGEGARLAGGRWNSKGVSLVYASASRALAALEILVHLNPPQPGLELICAELQIPEDAIEWLPSSHLPDSWREIPPGSATRALGDAWVARQSSPVLAVPSALIPEEHNFLLNPQHPRFASFKRALPHPFSLDPRLQR